VHGTGTRYAGMTSSHGHEEVGYGPRLLVAQQGRERGRSWSDSHSKRGRFGSHASSPACNRASLSASAH